MRKICILKDFFLVKCNKVRVTKEEMQVMENYIAKKGIVLQELINRYEKASINSNSKSDIQFLNDKLNTLFNIINSEYKESLGDMYQKIDFRTSNEKTSFLGGYISNIAKDSNGKIKRYPSNNRIEFYTKSFCADNLLGSKSVGRRIGACIEIIDTLEHEFTHYFQDIQKQQNKISPGSIESAKQAIQSKLKYDDVYQKNYWSMSDEIGARINAYEKTTNILRSISDNEKFKIYSYYYNYYRNPEDFDRYLKSTAIFNEAGEGSQDKNYFFNQRAEEYIRENPDILNLYKTLQHEYNMDGTKKSITQLISDCKEKMRLALNKEGISDNQKTKLRYMVRNTYFELIGSRLEEISPDEAKQIESFLGRR